MVNLITLLWFRIFGIGKRNETGFSRMLNTGIQYLLIDSIQTSVQEYLAKSVRQLLKTFGKGREEGLLILGKFVGSGNGI